MWEWGLEEAWRENQAKNGEAWNPFPHALLTHYWRAHGADQAGAWGWLEGLGLQGGRSEGQGASKAGKQDGGLRQGLCVIVLIITAAAHTAWGLVCPLGAGGEVVPSGTVAILGKMLGPTVKWRPNKQGKVCVLLLLGGCTHVHAPTALTSAHGDSPFLVHTTHVWSPPPHSL